MAGSCWLIAVILRSRRRLLFSMSRPGHFVIVAGGRLAQGDWWMGQVLFCEGSARHPRLPSLFQVADVDTGVIKWINADAVSDVIWSMDGWPTSAPVSSGC